jgi:hypothetical protein
MFGGCVYYDVPSELDMESYEVLPMGIFCYYKLQNLHLLLTTLVLGSAENQKSESAKLNWLHNDIPLILSMYLRMNLL